MREPSSFGTVPAPGETAGRRWSRLFRCSGAEDAAAEVAAWLDPEGGLELVVDEAWSPDPARNRAAIVSGSPPWRVRVSRRDAAEIPAGLAEDAAAAISAWRAARVEIARVEARAQVRTKELEALYSLGRALAEARTVGALFTTTAAVLHREAAVDTVIVAHALSGAPMLEVFASRPVPEGEIAAQAALWGGGLGWPSDARPEVRMRRVPAYDDQPEAERAPFHPDDAAVVPVLRRGRPAANLVLLAPDAGSERRIRFFFGASNHLALHLDRALTVLEAEQGRFRAILDSMPQAVFVTDPDLRVLQQNPAADAVASRLVRSGAGQLAETAGGIDLRALGARAISGAAAAGGGEARFSDGAHFAVTASPLGEGDRSPGLVFVFTDVSEARRLQEQVAQSEKLTSLGRMVSGVAHELNNPLASVMGFAQLARTLPPGDALNRRLEIIQREAERSTKIVRTLLRFARRYEPERRKVSLNEVDEAVLELLRYQLRVSGIEVRAELDPTLPAILGDSHELQQSVLNLVVNAQHAIASAERQGTIVLRTRADGPGGVALEVEDDGPGIPEAIRSKVFDPFFTTKPAGQGTGLGLSLVYGTVTAHGGTIELESRDGGGALFRVRLPLGDREAVPERPPSEASAAWRPRVSAKILVVDDEKSLASLICEALSADGHEVVPACSAEDVLRRLEEQPFDMVVSDLKMPGLGAARLLEEMRRLRPGLEHRLVLTSGDTVSREPEALAASVGADLVHKPFGLDDLRRVVRRRLAARPESGRSGH